MVVRDDDLLMGLGVWWSLPLCVLEGNMVESVAERKGEMPQDTSTAFSPLLFTCPELY